MPGSVNKDLNVDVENKEPSTTTDSTDNQEYSPGRRDLLKKGGIAVPVFLTLANRPVWGGNMQCWSGFQSGNLSRPDDRCSDGLSPGFYKSNVTKPPGWPTQFYSGCPAEYLKSNGTIMKEAQDAFTNTDPDFDLQLTPFKDGTLFTTVFTGGVNTEYAGLTLMQVLWQKSGSFGFHAIATYFNTFNFPNYVFQSNVALEIINSILSTGVYEDSRGYLWTQDEMKCVFDQSYHYDADHTDHVAGCITPP
jgi:hypothetical protein